MFVKVITPTVGKGTVERVRIVRFSPQYEDAHRAFASRYWKKRKRTESDYIYWKFRGSPDDPPTFLLAILEDKVVGQLGLIPCTVAVECKRIPAQWACDLMVDTSSRGKGIAKLLYEYAFQLCPLTLGSDPSPAAAKSMRRSGFASLQGPTKLVFPIYLGEIARLKGIDIGFLDRIPNPLLFVLKVWSSIRSTVRFAPVHLEKYQELVDKHYLASKFTARVSHSESFIGWRFRSFVGFYNGIETYCNDESVFSVYENGTLMIVTEQWTDSISKLIDFYSSILPKARKRGIRRIKSLAQSSSEKRWLSMFGFVPFRTPTEIIYYCNDTELRESIQRCHFYYTYLDSDENI